MAMPAGLFDPPGSVQDNLGGPGHNPGATTTFANTAACREHRTVGCGWRGPEHGGWTRSPTNGQCPRQRPAGCHRHRGRRHTQLVRTVELVARAQVGRTAAQRLANRVSAVFVPGVMLAAALTLVGWLALTGSLQAGFSAALAVSIVACPCALGLATPMALRAASGRGAQLGLVFRGLRPWSARPG